MAALSDQSSISSNSSCSSFHNSTLKSPSSSPGGGGGGRSRSFSISDILSDEVGSRKRSPPVVEQRGMPEMKHMRMESGQPLLTLGQAANVIISPINLSSPHPSLAAAAAAMHVAPSFTLGYTPSPFSYIPHPLTTPPRTISCSPFSGLTLTPTHPIPPTLPPPQLNEAMFSDSLNLLSTVASQQQAMAAASASSDSLQNQLEAMRLHSQLNDSSMSSNSSASATTGTHVDSSDENGSVTSRRASTPCILRHHRRKRREESSDYSHMDLENTSRGCMLAEACHLSPTGPHLPGRSPLKPPNVTFSPSIFLSQPGGGVSSTVSYSPHQTSPSANTEGGGAGSRFITSTPIRAGDHRGALTSPSYLTSIHSPISASKRGAESSEYSSSGSDSEMPLLRRPRVPQRRKAKARTSLSPLLENAHLPQHTKPPLPHSYPAPSTLLRSYSAYTPTSSHRLPEDSGVMADIPSQLMMTYPSLLHPVMAPYHMDSGLGLPHSSYGGHSMLSYPSKWGHSPVTDHFKRTGQIQSVPPWFICSDKKSDGKRLRLREAINKSLSETPSSSNTSCSQLPPEWKVYAYGQTADQKDLTQKARSFLRCRPRVLKFDPTPPPPPHDAPPPVAAAAPRPQTD